MLFRAMLVAVPVALVASSNARATGAAPIDPAASEIRFVSHQMNVPIDGRFRKISGTVRFDPAKPETARAAIQIDLGSIDAGSDDATAEVQRRKWFNIAAFPEAVFSASGATRIGENRYRTRGELSIKGIKRTVDVPFTVKRSGNSTIYAGGFQLLRLDFSIGEGAWSDTETVANEVEVEFRLVVNDRP